MNFYEQLGYLILGSRLRRLSDTFLSAIGNAYQQQGIEFEAAWFSVFYLLGKQDKLSIRELSEQTGVSHPAASQLITTLKKKGLVKTSVDKQDGRKQIVQFTKKGSMLLKQIMPMWDAILSSINELVDEHPQSGTLLNALSAMEDAFGTANLPGKISRHFQQNQLKQHGQSV